MSIERFLAFFDRKTTLHILWLSGLFSFVLVLGLLWSAVAHRAPLYFDPSHMLEAKAQLRENPNNLDLIQAIRAEDQWRREAYYLAQRRLLSGGYLLFGGLFVFALALRRLLVLNETLPEPVPSEQLAPHPREKIYTLASVLGIPAPVAIAVLVAFALNGWWQANITGQLPGAQVAAVQPSSEPPVPDNLKWPQLRGPNGMGTLENVDLPIIWDASKGENLIWKVPVPMRGNSSPVIWGNRLFLTGADLSARKVFCLDRKTGNLLWDCTLKTPGVSMEDMEDTGDTTLAAPTPVTDGKLLYVFFGTNELAAVDFLGRQVWARWFGKPESDFGISVSPRLFENLILLQLDQGSHPEEGKSMLYGIDSATGKTIWEVKRDVANSWTTPIVADTGQRLELITASNPWVISYDPKTGKEYWRAKVLKGAVAPLPVYCDGMTYTGTEFAKLSAIRTGADGDITASHVAWTYEEDLPDVASPVTDGKFLILPNSAGKVRCFDAKTGKLIWTKRFKKGFWSSPTLVGENVYLTDKVGNTTLFKLAETFQEVGKGTFGEPVITSFSVADSKIFVRGQDHVFCVGANP
jgi:outer membrane protein assembly factor BamB